MKDHKYSETHTLQRGGRIIKILLLINYEKESGLLYFSQSSLMCYAKVLEYHLSTHKTKSHPQISKAFKKFLFSGNHLEHCGTARCMHVYPFS